MIWALAADAVLLLHALFIALVGFGGLASLVWPRFAWVHLPALAWGVFVSLTGALCPLTPIEQQLRLAAGQQGYAGGFIDHYLIALIYPAGLTRSLQIGLGLALVALNLAVYLRLWYRHR